MASIGIVIPTFQGAKHLIHSLPPLLQSPLKPKILIIDSSSTDDTVNIARDMGAETLVIPKREFNHGKTREMGRRLLSTPIVVMMTQDAYAASPEMLQYLVNPILQKKASISYARQLPHHDANFFASFLRYYNYPSESHIRGLQDINTYGIYTFFCSNSCAAYSNRALDEIEGFPAVSFGEDTIVVAKLLHRHHSIAYVAEAKVFHSHNYTLRQEFRRHIDIGFARNTYRNLIAIAGSDNQRGKDYVKNLLKALWKNSPSKIPYALLQTAVKFCGYQFGQTWSKTANWLRK